MQTICSTIKRIVVKAHKGESARMRESERNPLYDNRAHFKFDDWIIPAHSSLVLLDDHHPTTPSVKERRAKKRSKQPAIVGNLLASFDTPCFMRPSNGTTETGSRVGRSTLRQPGVAVGGEDDDDVMVWAIRRHQTPSWWTHKDDGRWQGRGGVATTQSTALLYYVLYAFYGCTMGS